MKMEKRKRKLARRVLLRFAVLEERDANDNQILVVKGERFYHVDEGKAGKGERADHVWASKKGAQLIFRGPGYKHADFVPALTGPGRRLRGEVCRIGK
jgi:hypothetical protein